jgi:hypothetical protein
MGIRDHEFRVFATTSSGFSRPRVQGFPDREFRGFRDGESGCARTIPGFRDREFLMRA